MKYLALFIFFCFLFLIPIVRTSEDSGYKIIEDSVKWENQFGLLQVYPHTCYDFTCVQYANATSKVAQDRDLNISFIFPEKIKGKIWLWQNFSHVVKVAEKMNCTQSAECLIIINETMCEIYDEFDPSIYNQTCEYIQNNTCYWNYTCYSYHDEERWFYDWKDKTHLMNHLKHGNKHYYYLLNVPFKALETKQVKWQYNVPIRLTETGFGSSGKWELYLWRGDYKNPTKYVKLDPWWDTNWNYRKSHNITSTIAQTNYQVNITIYNTTGTDSGNNVYISNKAQEDFDDVRFINSTDDEIDYWIEEFGSDYAKFWVEIPNIPANDNETIYIYYGNDTVSSKSNGTNTFIIWDDFDLGYSVGDTPKSERGWTNIAGKVEIDTDPADSSNLVLMEYYTPTNTLIKNTFGSPTTLYPNISVHMKARTNTTYYWYAPYVLGDGTTSNRWLGGSLLWYTGSTWTTYTPSATYSTNTWYQFELHLNLTGYDLIKDGITHVGGFRASPTLGWNQTHFGRPRGSKQAGFVDNFFVRKFIKPEPSHGDWGSEEGVDISPPAFSNNATNTTIREQPCNFTITISDATGVSGYIFSTNNSGTWENSSWVSTSGTSVTGWNITTLNSTVGVTIQWKFYANDTAGNYWSGSSTYSLITTEKPYWSDNSTNSTIAGQPTEFRLRWKDNEGLLGHTFSLDNCTGTFVNQTFQYLGGDGTDNLFVNDNTSLYFDSNWGEPLCTEPNPPYGFPFLGDNDNRICVNTHNAKYGNLFFEDSTKRGKIFSVNLSVEYYWGRDFFVTYLDKSELRWKNTSVVGTGVAGDYTWHSWDLSDNITAWDEIDNFRVWITKGDSDNNYPYLRRMKLVVNASVVKDDWINSTYTINDTVGCTIRWIDYTNDTDGNWNTSDTFSFVTTEAVVTTTVPKKLIKPVEDDRILMFGYLDEIENEFARLIMCGLEDVIECFFALSHGSMDFAKALEICLEVPKKEVTGVDCGGNVDWLPYSDEFV